VGEDRFKTRETVDEDVVTRGEGQQTRKIFTEEILAGEKGCVLNWSSGSVDDRHSREQVGLDLSLIHNDDVVLFPGGANAASGTRRLGTDLCPPTY
jgi:hypothetical protein